MQSDSVSVTGVSLSLSLLVWEGLESRDVAGLIQICFLRPAWALAIERNEHRNHARLWAPEASCKPSHPRPTAPVGEKHPRFQPISNPSVDWRPSLTCVMDKIMFKHVLALEMHYLLEASEDLHEWNPRCSQ